VCGAADTTAPDVTELTAALSTALRRTQRRLAKAGFTARVLTRAELTETLDELRLDDTEPGTEPPSSDALAEEWEHWRTPTSAQATLAVVGWPEPSSPAAALAFDRLASAAGVPTALSLGIRRTDRGVEVEAVVRVSAASRRAVDQAVAQVESAAVADGLQLRRLDGEHVHGVAATLPLGAFLS
jgi:type VII secretion protein EccE